jgi:hypothetical protein
VVCPQRSCVDTGAGTLNDEGMTEFRLGEGQRHEVRAAARRAMRLPLIEMTPESFPLPTAGGVLRRLAREVTDGVGYALLHGVPVDDDADFVAVGVGSYIGTVVAQGAERAPVQRVTDRGSDPHCAMLSHPRVVADLILDAARAVC